MEEENLVCVYAYPLQEEFVESFIEQEKQLTNEDIKTDIHRILEDNFITYKNKLVDNWTGRDYKIVVEVYVYEVNYLKAKQLIDELLNYDGEYHYDDINYKGEENNE